MQPLDRSIKNQLDPILTRIGVALSADAMTIISPISPGLENIVRNAVESFPVSEATSIAIILETPGGIAEVVERMVNTIRNRYHEVVFIVPNRAMSAGTIFVMSGDRILMDYFSCLGPIDPQVQKDGKLVPALAYVGEFERLNNIAKQGQLSAAEYALLSKLDLGELYQFQQARELSIDLLKKWLSAYKFKNWLETETNKMPVTKEMREQRASDIANELSKNDRWHSHGRGLTMGTLQNELNLKIEDFGAMPIKGDVHAYFELLSDYMQRFKLSTFVHTPHFF